MKYLLLVFTLLGSISIYANERDMRISRIKANWKGLVDYENIAKLGSLYAQDVRYRDPVVDINGIETLIKYWQKLHEKYHYIEFKYKDSIIQGDKVAVMWVMEAESKTLNLGQRILVPGMSHIEFSKKNCIKKLCSSDKIVKQVDYMDMGAAVYQYVPVSMPVGAFVKAFKAKVNSELEE